MAAVPGRWDVARSYFVLGVEHILTGYDHLLFVVSLVLLLGQLGEGLAERRGDAAEDEDQAEQ